MGQHGHTHLRVLELFLLVVDAAVETIEVGADRSDSLLHRSAL